MKEVIVLVPFEEYGVGMVSIEAVGYGWSLEGDPLVVAKRILEGFSPEMSEDEVFGLIERIVEEGVDE